MNKSIQKKGTSELWWILATAIIVLVVIVIILVFFKGGAEKLFDGIGGQISGLDDCDGDKIADSFDACPCVRGLENGCPTDKPSDEEKREIGDKSCCINKVAAE